MTTKITKITRKDARTINDAVRKALQGVADQFGLSYTAGGRVSFNDAEMRGSFTLAAVAESGVPADFIKNCGRYGLKPEHFGAEFKSGRDTFKITGIKPRRPKYPVCASRVKDGRSFKFTTNQVINGLLNSRPSAKDGFKIGDRVAFEGFEGGVTGTIQSFLGKDRAEVLTTTGETRTPERSKLTHSNMTRTEAEILNDIGCVYGNLSPENLTCDGECSRTEVNRRSRAYNKALKALFKELGREVSESEFYASVAS